MTASEVERRLTALLDQHAEEAMNQTDTTREHARFQERVEQDTRGRNRRWAATGAAAVTAAAVGVGAVWLGLQPEGSPAPADSPSTSPSAATPSESPAPPEEPQTPGSTVQGFEGVETFPMQFVVPQGFSPATEDGGTRGYVIDGTSGSAAAFLISSLAQVPASELPDDLAGHVERSRDDLVVTDVSTTEVGGRPAQSFTLTQKPGTSPSDLWCAKEGGCFKLLPEKPMDVIAVRTGNGLVLFEVEYLPQDEQKVRAPMRKWLRSVRWE